MTLATRRIGILLVLSVALTFVSAPAGALTIIMRSGNAPAGSPDPLITQLQLAGPCSAGFPAAFTAADFAAAAAGPPAFVLSFVHPAWLPSLPCDPAAKWIGIDPGATPRSALFAMKFFVPASDSTGVCCYDGARLNFCWSVDDFFGDGINPAGLYVNGNPIPAASGGSYATESSLSGIDVSPYVHCGDNTLYFYDRDAACAVSGLNFSARLDMFECFTPAPAPSWGSVKALYR